MSTKLSSTTALRVADLSQNMPTPFILEPDVSGLAAISTMLELISIRKLRFYGEIQSHAVRDWMLTGKLGATVTQPCGITLRPVITRIDVPVCRIYLYDYEQIKSPEVEMTGDDEFESLGKWIDPEAVLIESLSLALPTYPRAHGASLEETVLTEPGLEPLTEQAMKPFAGLSDLKDKLKGNFDT
ncbi:MAG TPA: hypothetical protein DCE52_12845 [Rhodobacteraceae bacterium]|nr:DUF177 domain-containing protein [Tateyamaria sp.]MDG1420448.1 DUF177 domain-containing protein [Tateyamaria sp.]MDG1677662.1 DUF177 domain-containing protein [Tateyamaria sp.]MDG2379095.1 DUF177 domain-containing protein [Tateyamaria sp.]HAB38861.1 hypothetical protein [Paracoccaceae bacterium]